MLHDVHDYAESQIINYFLEHRGTHAKHLFVILNITNIRPKAKKYESSSIHF